MQFENLKLWELVDTAPEYVQDTAGLIEWSRNYDARRGGTPYLVFLDLIGYSFDEYGCVFVENPWNVLGYLEIDYLADALKEYAERPQDVLAFVNAVRDLETVEGN